MLAKFLKAEYRDYFTPISSVEIETTSNFRLLSIGGFVSERINDHIVYRLGKIHKGKFYYI